jgi:glycosyltransferase involved in cell wall biosynthesis
MSNKIKVTIVTGEDFFDVDMPVLLKLSEFVDLTWVPVFRNYGWISKDELILYCINNKLKYKIISQKYKIKDPRAIFINLKILFYLRKQKGIIYFNYSGFPFLHFLTPIFLGLKRTIIAIHDVELHHNTNYGKYLNFYFDFVMNKFINFHIFSKSQLNLFEKKHKNKNVLLSPLALKDFGGQIAKKKSKLQINFLFFGIIRDNKGLDILINAFESLLQTHKNIHLTIAGNCKDFSKYQDLIKTPTNYSLNIRQIANDEVSNLFNEAHYTILPYKDVTQSGVLLTSYNYNVPVIASSFDGFKEYINDDIGYLFKPNDVSDLALTMNKSIQEFDSKYDLIYSSLSRFIEENISIDYIVKNYIQFINKFQ